MIKFEKIAACNKCGGNCWGCFYAEECPTWNDVGWEVVEIPVKVNYVGLCRGRHEIPEVGNDYIFDTIEDITNTEKMTSLAREWFSQNRETNNIKLYVTGLTPALCCFLAVARELKMHLTTMHFDRDKGTYFEIPV